MYLFITQFIEIKMSDNSYNKWDLVNYSRDILQQSQNNNLISYKEGSYFIKKAEGVEQVSFKIEHNLGYEPVIFCYYSRDNVNFSKVPYNTALFELFNLTVYAEVDNVDLTITIECYATDSMSTSPELLNYFQYSILRERSA